MGLEIGDHMFKANSRKVKFVVKGGKAMPTDDQFPPKFTDFDVVHHYLQVKIMSANFLPSLTRFWLPPPTPLESREAACNWQI